MAPARVDKKSWSLQERDSPGCRFISHGAAIGPVTRLSLVGPPVTVLVPRQPEAPVRRPGLTAKLTQYYYVTVL